MANNHQSPLWNQDLVLAVGLAFAGLVVLQSKLFPACAVLDLSFLSNLLAWKFLEWWPLLLIAGGVILWIQRMRIHGSKKDAGAARANWR
ncbi:MAG TPA: hypothetical protein VH596_12490 [Terriglobales bacterium]|jgi:hypothetical protein